MSLSRFTATLITALCLLSCTQEKIVVGNKTLRVMSWNIWHAGHSKQLPSYGCKATLGIIKESGADVILIIETYGAENMVADHLGYYHRSLSSNLSIYSRYPITNTYTFTDTISTSNFGGVEIDMNGQRVRIFNTWLHYLPDAREVPTHLSEAEILAWDDAGSRDEEIATMLRLIEPFIAETDSIPIIMGGDFNSHSHLDWVESTKDLYNRGGAVVNWSVSKKMKSAGFKDSFRVVNDDPVEDIGTTWMHPVNEDYLVKRPSMETIGKYTPYSDSDTLRQDRIDFIYYKGAQIEAIESEIHNTDIGLMLPFKGKEFFYASDHGFVLTTFKMNNSTTKR